MKTRTVVKREEFHSTRISGMVDNCTAPAEVPRGKSLTSVLSPRALELLSTFPINQFVFKSDFPDFSQPGAPDLYSGRKGVAREIVKLGCPWVLTFDCLHGVGENLLDLELRTKIEEMIECGCFLTCGAAPVCASFSVAVTPGIPEEFLE